MKGTKRASSTSKKAAKRPPSFDVARSDIGTSAGGWVYRSSPATPPPPRVVQDFRAARDVIDLEPTTSEDMRVRASAPVLAPATSPRSGHPWIEASVQVAVFPLTLTVVAVVAPLMWMFGPRSHK